MKKDNIDNIQKKEAENKVCDVIKKLSELQTTNWDNIKKTGTQKFKDTETTNYSTKSDIFIGIKEKLKKIGLFFDISSADIKVNSSGFNSKIKEFQGKAVLKVWDTTCGISYHKNSGCFRKEEFSFSSNPRNSLYGKETGLTFEAKNMLSNLLFKADTDITIDEDFTKKDKEIFVPKKDITGDDVWKLFNNKKTQHSVYMKSYANKYGWKEEEHTTKFEDFLKNSATKKQLKQLYVVFEK